MQVPIHIQNALTLAGGKRLNGEPNYKFMWSGDFTYLISSGTTYEPFRVVADDCWLLVKYELPEFWGTQEEWEANNWEMGTAVDSETGLTHIEPLYTAGPYPRQGRYRNIMRIKRQVMINGEPYMENCAPTIKWVEEFFPGVRDFLNLTTEQKRKHLEDKEKSEKEALTKSFIASRENYRGIATSKQIQDRVEGIERFLSDPENAKQVLQLTKRSVN